MLRFPVGRCWMVATALTALVALPAEGGELKIQPGEGAITVTTGAYRWVLSTSAFDVIHAGTVGGQQRIGAGQVTIDALGGTSVLGPPSEVKTGTDWVELRGWADRGKNLWYIARYQFFADRPFVRLVLTLTDRHDKSPASEPWDKYWNNRWLSRWRLQLGAPGGKPAIVTQHNSYSHSSPGAPWIDVVNATGAPYQWAPGNPPVDPARFQLVHQATKDGLSQIVWHPMYEGSARLTATISGFTGGAAYLAAKSATYEIVDAAGQTHTKTGDQRDNSIELGTFTLSKSSVVRLKATGEGNVVAGVLRVTPANHGRPFEITLGARHDGTLTDGPLTLAVKDFWQHHPISLVRTPNAVGWQAIEKPEQYTGGMGVTIESLISMDGPAGPAVAALDAPPARELPKGLFAADGSMVKSPIGARYDALLKLFAGRYWADLESMDSFGWRNWGDYQIGVSYAHDANPTEDWANLQYDLPNGLLLAWLRTGDPSLWRFAQASVRHLMDLDLVKFHPFMDKLNGLVYRKGEMPRSRSHISAEPITDQGFAFRSLLLYHHLTGEQWALDLAKQNIDTLVYYAVSRPQFVLHGGRPTAWMLRAALAGAEHFPSDPDHHYQAVADNIASQLVAYYKSNGRLPGNQPVWQGQMIEGLAQYHHQTGRADVAEVIVGYVRRLLTESVRRKPDGSYEFMYCLVPDHDCSPQWTDEDNYAFLWLSPIAYAFQLSHDPFFAGWGEALFSYAESKYRNHHDIRSWTSALAFPHLYLELSRAAK